MSENLQPVQKSNTPNFNQIELDLLKVWAENKTFEKSLEQTKDAKPFVFYDGPPFATGLPHYGSILPSVIKDAVPRYQTMRGRFVRRKWGWDCHGLPIENIVEKKLGISGKKQIEELGVDVFNQTCRENVLTLAHEWGKMVHRIARWTEFDNAYKTMDTTYQESVWWALKQLWDKKLVYQDRKVLLYCARCETPISNFEVAMDNSYRDVSDNTATVRFLLTPRQRIGDFLVSDNTFVLAWTTTPWTLPSNAALAVSAEARYVLVERDGAQYIVGKERLEDNLSGAEILQEFSGRSLEGLSYEPIYKHIGFESAPGNPSAYKIYAEEFVTTTDGTGVVHISPLHGEDDYQLGKKKSLPNFELLNHQGHFTDEAPEFLRGKFFKGADKLVLEDLTQRGLIFKTDVHLHSYPHCHRCATPLYYSALPAWFINIQEIKQQLVQNNQPVSWYPEHLKHGRFELGLKNAPDWNISRNRYWATALPFWKCENTECRNFTCIGSVSELKEKSTNFSEIYPSYVSGGGVELLDLHKPYIDKVLLACEKCQGVMKRVPEVVDCWVESGSMPFAELHAPFENEQLFKERFPSDFVVEYIPQTRAWFYVMHVIGTALFGRSPFQNVMTTGTILGADGTKMSKSKGNYPDPNEVIDLYGADALRFYLLSSPVVAGEDINFSEVGVKEVQQKVSMLLYNVWSFYRLYETASGLQVAAEPVEVKHVLDVWVIERLKAMQGLVTKHLDAYATAKASQEIISFVSDLSTWYVRRSRDRMKSSSPEAKKALAVLAFVLCETSKVLAPFMPFLSDFIFRDLTSEDSVHLVRWSEVREADGRTLTQMDLVRQVVSLALGARKSSGISVRQPLAGLAFKFSGDANLSFEHEQIILEELNVKSVVEYDSLRERSLRDPASVSEATGSGSVTSVLLDTELNDELKAEGLARELERAVQDLRKKSGLKVGQLVDVYYNTADDSVEAAFLLKFDRKKTFVNQVDKNLEVETDFEIQIEISGVPVWIGLVLV